MADSVSGHSCLNRQYSKRSCWYHNGIRNAKIAQISLDKQKSNLCPNVTLVERVHILVLTRLVEAKPLRWGKRERWGECEREREAKQNWDDYFIARKCVNTHEQPSCMGIYDSQWATCSMMYIYNIYCTQIVTSLSLGCTIVSSSNFTNTSFWMADNLVLQSGFIRYRQRGHEKDEWRYTVI